jgi:hypothetical protein
MATSFAWVRNGTAVAVALLLLVPAASHAREDFATAARQHQEGRWSGAYGRFIAAGRRGDAAAADAALFMHRFGPLLYRTQWDLSSDEAEDLARVVRSAGMDAAHRPPLLEAAAHYRQGELGAAFARFAALGTQGHPDAARVALFMHTHGPALYGRYWPASPDELRRWRDLVATRPAPAARPLASVSAKRAP